MHRRKTQYRKRNNAYYLKRGETIRGPLERAAILRLALGRTSQKAQLQEMQRGSDVIIRWLVPPQDREALKKWLRSIGDQPYVFCPYCNVSIKSSNLLKHCDKLHPINRVEI